MQYATLKKDGVMPRHFQEAAYLYGNLEKNVDISNMPFDPAVVESYKAFMTAVQKNSRMSEEQMKNALKLKLPAVRLTVPEYDWECQGFLVNEGPSCLIHDGNLYLTYSASATDERYAMGLLTLPKGADPLDAGAWTKSPTPVMVSEPENEQRFPYTVIPSPGAVCPAI